MSLCLLLLDKHNPLPDPYVQWNAPQINDFSYRDDLHHQRFFADQQAWDELVSQYEDHDLGFDDTINSVKFGYGAFMTIQHVLAEHIGWSYYLDSDRKRMLNCPGHRRDEESLATFFTHSDCDGELGPREIRSLYRAMRGMKADNLDVQLFLKFLEKSAKIDHGYWRYV